MIVDAVISSVQALPEQIAVTLAHYADPVAARRQQLPVAGVVFDITAAVGLMAAARLELVARLAVDGFEREVSGKGGVHDLSRGLRRASPAVSIY
jgi:hypothetical protein